jgi:putative flippase GtrA
LPDNIRRTLKQFLMFGAIGVVGFVADAGVLYMLLHSTHAGFYLGRLVSYLCAATVTWFLNRTITFRASGSGVPPHHEWLRFLGANALGGLVNLGVYSLLVARVALFTATPVLAVAVGSLSGLAVNFVLTKAYVFRPDRLAS